MTDPRQFAQRAPSPPARPCPTCAWRRDRRARCSRVSRRLIVVVIAAVAAMSSACAGCGVPFQFTHEASFLMPVWVAGDCAWSGSFPLDGSFDDTGPLVQWREERDGDRCAVDAAWTGPLLDVEAARGAVEGELGRAGLDPSQTTITFTQIEPNVELVPIAPSMPNASGVSALPEGSILAYSGAISVGADPPLLSFEFTGPGDPLEPHFEVDRSEQLVQTVNTAWQTNVPLSGRASGRLVLALEALQRATEIPLVELRVIVDVKGELLPLDDSSTSSGSSSSASRSADGDSQDAP